jgi:hypothetical protein
MRILFIGFVLILTSCNQSRNTDLIQYINGRQVLSLNGLTRDGTPLDNPKIEIISPDTIILGEPFFAKIFLADNNYKLIDAYFDCKTVDNPTVDTVVNTIDKLKRLDGCTKRLFVGNDTILISFTPAVPGQKTFEEITVLTRDNERIFRTQKYTFDYYVAEN